MDKIILIGGGGHALSCIDVIESRNDFKIAGIILKDKKDKNKNNFNVLGYEKDLLKLRKKYKYAHIAVGQIKDYKINLIKEGTIINSFGVMNPYSNPEYLSGLLKSLFEIDAYLKILFTSFFGIFAVKTLSLFTDPLSFISSIYVPDEKITQYINDYVTFDWIYFISVLFFSILFSQKLLVKDSV